MKELHSTSPVLPEHTGFQAIEYLASQMLPLRLRKKEEKFDIDRLYDTTTYEGRFRTQVQRCNIAMFFVSDKRVQEAQAAIQDYKQRASLGEPSSEEILELRGHQRVVAATVHPLSQEIIPRQQRLSGLSLLNIPHVYCMLFVQGPPLFRCANIAYNQTLQAMVNYGNGNIRSPEKTSEILRSFGSAVALAGTILLGSRVLFAKQFRGLTGGRLVMANTILNMVAVGTANATNVMVLRRKELAEGISIRNKSGTVEYGTSTEAGKRAVLETCASRLFMPLPGLLVPVATYALLQKTRCLPKNSAALALFRALFVYTSFSLIALPMSTAIFQPKQEMSTDEMDDDLQYLGASKDCLYDDQKIYFYKGT